jgi:hypothetical protein
LIAPVEAGIDKDSREEGGILEEGYSKDSQKIVQFLTTLRKPNRNLRGVS